MGYNRRQFLRGAGATVGIATVGVASGQEAPTVEMITDGSEYIFDPIGLHVEPGTTVTFEIASGSHSATAYEDRIPDGASPWDSGTLSESGATWEYTFEAEGTHDYYCIPHKTLGMIGRVVVGEPGGPAEGSMPPDGEVPESDVIVENGSVSWEAFQSGAVGGGSGGTGGGSPLVGAGLFGGLAVLSAVIYWFVNSEGEYYRVGSGEWRRSRGLE